MQLALAVWNKGAVPSQYRILGPNRWAGARNAVLGAEGRLHKSLSPARLAAASLSPATVSSRL